MCGTKLTACKHKMYDIESGEQRLLPALSDKQIILRRSASASFPRPSLLYSDMMVLNSSQFFLESSSTPSTPPSRSPPPAGRWRGRSRTGTHRLPRQVQPLLQIAVVRLQGLVCLGVERLATLEFFDQGFVCLGLVLFADLLTFFLYAHL